MHAVERADELVLHGATAHGHGAQRERAGRDREQGAEQWRAVFARGARSATTSGRGLDEIGEHALQLRLGATDPFGTRTTLGDELHDRPRAP